MSVTAIASAGATIASTVGDLFGGGGGDDGFRGDWGGNLGEGDISPQDGLNGQHHPGPFTVAGVEAAIRSAGMDSPVVRDLAQKVWGSCEFTGECGPAVPERMKRSPRKLANAAVFTAHGGVNGDMVRYERAIRAKVQAVLDGALPGSAPQTSGERDQSVTDFILEGLEEVERVSRAGQDGVRRATGRTGTTAGSGGTRDAADGPGGGGGISTQTMLLIGGAVLLLSMRS